MLCINRRRLGLADADIAGLDPEKKPAMTVKDTPATVAVDLVKATGSDTVYAYVSDQDPNRDSAWIFLGSDSDTPYYPPSSYYPPGKWQYYVSQAGGGESGVSCFLCMPATYVAFPRPGHARASQRYVYGGPPLIRIRGG